MLLTQHIHLSLHHRINDLPCTCKMECSFLLPGIVNRRIAFLPSSLRTLHSSFYTFTFSFHFLSFCIFLFVLSISNLILLFFVLSFLFLYFHCFIALSSFLFSLLSFISSLHPVVLVTFLSISIFSLSRSFLLFTGRRSGWDSCFAFERSKVHILVYKTNRLSRLTSFVVFLSHSGQRPR